MVTAIYAARNILGEHSDVWDVNVEAGYHEEVRKEPLNGEGKGARGGDPLVPERVDYDPRLTLVVEAFARYDAVALGAAFAVVLGLGLFLATAALCLKGGEVVRSHLGLLA